MSQTLQRFKKFVKRKFRKIIVMIFLLIFLKRAECQAVGLPLPLHSSYQQIEKTDVSYVIKSDILTTIGNESDQQRGRGLSIIIDTEEPKIFFISECQIQMLNLRAGADWNSIADLVILILTLKLLNASSHPLFIPNSNAIHNQFSDDHILRQIYFNKQRRRRHNCSWAKT